MCSEAEDSFIHFLVRSFINPVFRHMIKSQMSTRCICAAFRLWQPLLFLCFCLQCSTFQVCSRSETALCFLRNAEAESLFFTEAEEIYTEKVHSSTRQELPAQTAEYSLLVVIVIIIKTWKQFQKQKFQSAVWTILSTEPGLSADSTSSHPHYILWPLEHFVDCCQRVSGGKRPKQPELGDDGSVEGVSELSP